MIKKLLGAQQRAALPKADSRDLKVEYVDVETLKPYAGNARTHSSRQIRQIETLVKEFGWTNPILIDDEGNIIAGHGRLEAAKRVGLSTVPIIRLRGLSEAQKRAYALADNKVAENAGWDRESLAIELQFLTEADLDFDVTDTGFETGEIDFLIESLEPVPEDDPADEIPETDPDQDLVTRNGDLWLLGSHRVLCGDARDGQAFQRLLSGRSAEMAFVDPPYNVRIGGNVSGLGSVRHGEFVMGSGEMTEADYIRFLETTLGNHAANSVDGSIHYVCMDWRHLHELLTVGRGIYTELKNLCVWRKTNAGMGSFYRSQHELVAVFKNGTAPHLNNFELGQYGRHRSNVWDYAGLNSLSADRLDTLRLHPTPKPAALVADAIRDCSRRGGAILDGFIGSGTTIIAAERTGRVGYGLELDPKYVDVAVLRWQALVGEEAVHAETGLTFGQVADLRHPNDAARRSST